jgi:predicted nucleic acid-binding protein
VSAYLLDTNHLSPLVTPGHPLRQRVVQALQAGHSFAVCVPVLAEMLFGIGILPRAVANLAEWERLKPNFRFYAPDVVDAEKAAALQIALRRQGWQLETVDALVAITAERYRLILLTRDKDFTRVPGIRLEQWL